MNFSLLEHILCVLYIPSKSHTVDAWSLGLNYKPYERTWKLKNKIEKVLKISYVVRGIDLRDVRGTNYCKTGQIYSCCLFLFPALDKFVSIFLAKLSSLVRTIFEQNITVWGVRICPSYQRLHVIHQQHGNHCKEKGPETTARRSHSPHRLICPEICYIHTADSRLLVCIVL